jgi:hypothetical protein
MICQSFRNGPVSGVFPALVASVMLCRSLTMLVIAVAASDRRVAWAPERSPRIAAGMAASALAGLSWAAVRYPPNPSSPTLQPGSVHSSLSFFSEEARAEGSAGEADEEGVVPLEAEGAADSDTEGDAVELVGGLETLTVLEDFPAAPTVPSDAHPAIPSANAPATTPVTVGPRNRVGTIHPL